VSLDILWGLGGGLLVSGGAWLSFRRRCGFASRDATMGSFGVSFRPIRCERERRHVGVHASWSSPLNYEARHWHQCVECGLACETGSNARVCESCAAPPP
jgi:hypothetical protein